MKLQITKLARDLSEADLKKIFEKFGPVEECSLVLDKTTGKSKGFAFVTMANDDNALKAIADLNGKTVNRVQMKVKAVLT